MFNSGVDVGWPLFIQLIAFCSVTDRDYLQTLMKIRLVSENIRIKNNYGSIDRIILCLFMLMRSFFIIIFCSHRFFH